MKLDLADKYDPLSYSDEYMEGHVDSTPTIKVQMIPFLPKVIVSDEGEEEDDTWGERDTIPCPPPYPQPHMKREVNWSVVWVLLFTIAFWGTVTYFIFR
jgi:hypothetical protein